MFSDMRDEAGGRQDRELDSEQEFNAEFAVRHESREYEQDEDGSTRQQDRSAEARGEVTVRSDVEHDGTDDGALG